MPRAVGGWKICSKCRENKSVSEFRKNRGQADGYDRWCKTCRQAYYAAHRSTILAQQSIYGRATGYAAQRQYESSKKGRVTRRRYDQSEKGQGTLQRYNQTEKGKATRRRGWLSAAHKQATKRHRARKAGCVGSHTIAEFFELCKAYDFRCLCCKEVFSFEDLTEDHVVPIGPGVSDGIDNIQPLCSPCNARKGMRTIGYRALT